MRSLFATIQQLVVPAGTGANSPAVSLGAQVPPELAAHYAPSRVVACMIFRRAAADYVYLALVVPTTGTPFIAVGGVESVFGILQEAYRVRPSFGQITTTFRSVLELAGTTEISGPWSIDGRSAGRGLVGWDARSGSTGPIGTTYVEVLTVSTTFRAGRAYRLEIGGRGVASASTNVLQFATNWDPGTGDIAWWQPGGFGPSGASAPIPTYGNMIARNATTTDKSGLWRIYLRADPAGTVNWFGPRYAAAYDIGAAADYPLALDVP
mgnify:CR=1 FL=1